MPVPRAYSFEFINIAIKLSIEIFTFGLVRRIPAVLYNVRANSINEKSKK